MGPVTHNRRPNGSPINKLDKGAAYFICLCSSSLLSLSTSYLFFIFSCLFSFHLSSDSLSAFLRQLLSLSKLSFLHIHQSINAFLVPFFILSSLPHHFLLTCSDRGKQSWHSLYSHAHWLPITFFRYTQSQYTIKITNKRNEYQLIFAWGSVFYS